MEWDGNGSMENEHLITYKSNNKIMWKELKEVQHLYSNVKIWWGIPKLRRKDRALNIKKVELGQTEGEV